MWEHYRKEHRRVGGNLQERRRGQERMQDDVAAVHVVERWGWQPRLAVFVRVLVHCHTVMNDDLTQSLALCPQSPALTRERCSGAGKHARALVSRLPSRWRDEVMADAQACSNTHSLSLGCCTGACGMTPVGFGHEVRSCSQRRCRASAESAERNQNAEIGRAHV